MNVEREPVESGVESRSRDAARRLVARRAAAMIATVEMMTGRCEVRDPDSGHWHDAAAGARIARNASIRVKSGRVLVRMDDGTDVWLTQGSMLELTRWDTAARTVRLAVGRALALVAHDLARPFRAETPAGAVLVTGTAFDLCAEESRLAVVVLEGSVRVEAGNRSMPLTRGASTEGNARDGLRPAARADRAATAALWREAIERSRENPTLSATCSRAARNLEPKTSPTMGKGDFSMTRVLTIVAALAIAGGAAWFLLRPSPVPPQPAGAVAGPGGGEAMTVKLDLNDPKSLDKALADLPAEMRPIVAKRFKVEDGKLVEAPGGEPTPEERAIMSKYGGLQLRVTAGSGDGDGPSDEALAAFRREEAAAMDSLRKMLAEGVDPAEAKRNVEDALTDSFRKHLDPNASVKVDLNVDPATGRENARIMIERPDGGGPNQ